MGVGANSAAGRGRGRAWAAAGLAALLLAGGGFLAWRAASRFDPSVLVGRWQRPDGGYLLEIVRVLPGGALEARYFNPRPIHVARAEVQEREGGPDLFVELRDQGYPGCTYQLDYLPGSDSLAGVYYQAAIGETFDVRFGRIGDATEAGNE
ncbi:MAG: hypothetical protein KA248_05220 [Kiritimatiellae bacterium]|nr:hypothetical protein [Kiritimatiellia bacterium]